MQNNEKLSVLENLAQHQSSQGYTRGANRQFQFHECTESRGSVKRAYMLDHGSEVRLTG
jgi:hypothetical protein